MAQGDKGSSIIGVRTGYTTFDFGDLKGIMKSAVSLYRENGLPMEVQTNFPGNAIIGAEAVFTNGMLRYGGGFYYTRTMAFSGYRDGGGSLRLKMNATMLILQTIIGLNTEQWSSGHSYICLKPSVLRGTWDIKEEGKFTDFPDQNSESYFSTTLEALAIEGMIGVRQRISNWLYSEAEFGYRYSGLKSKLYNPSGFIAGFSAAVEF